MVRFVVAIREKGFCRTESDFSRTENSFSLIANGYMFLIIAGKLSTQLNYWFRIAV